MDINKLIQGLLAALIAAAGGVLFNHHTDIAQMKLRMDYVEKSVESCVTPDKLENTKLQLSQQITMGCK